MTEADTSAHLKIYIFTVNATEPVALALISNLKFFLYTKSVVKFIPTSNTASPWVPGNDNLKGTSAAEIFEAGDGNDSMIGRGGADVFHGGAGDDAAYQRMQTRITSIGNRIPLTVSIQTPHFFNVDSLTEGVDDLP
ncbi:hypothetical protein [Nitrosomonas ureae]|uniref:Hemolysin-type calcium-binding repeat-containing protein n=1 Tax=Nitrosomonas ureae TaxID=44577 RepID=A0A286AJL4_9PROT|nr:hypothetical protein [Nitrosomonas ureae]SOD22100.1 hypothetical protein SAMN06297164_3348 [Nitrosomonas ureae]